MSDEMFRKELIYLLKNSKLYYINSMGEHIRYFEEEQKQIEIKRVIENIEDLKNLFVLGNAFSLDNNIPKLNYEYILRDEEERIDMLNRIKTISINNDSTFEDIAKQISDMCDYEEYRYIDEDLKLYELKKARERGSKSTLEYLNSKK